MPLNEEQEVRIFHKKDKLSSLVFSGNLPSSKVCKYTAFLTFPKTEWF